MPGETWFVSVKMFAVRNVHVFLIHRLKINKFLHHLQKLYIFSVGDEVTIASYRVLYGYQIMSSVAYFTYNPNTGIL